MEDTLKRLLEAELRAERRVQEADSERERLIRQALMDARAAEEQLEARIPELHATFVRKAEARAEQAIHELERRYQERARQIESLAEARRGQAVTAALAVMLGREAI